MGRKPPDYLFILPKAKLDYTYKEIDTFVSMWKDGQPVSAIAEKLFIQKYEVALLVMHCELDGLIGPREGGLWGTKEHKWKQGRREKGDI